MRKVSILLVAGIFAVSLAGCVTVEKVTRERVDQGVSGNQGYLSGYSTEIKEPGPTTREYIDVKVEIPTWQEITEEAPKPKPRARQEYTVDKDVSGNQGYISGSKGYEEYEYVEVDEYEEDVVEVRETEPYVYEYDEYYEEEDIIEDEPVEVQTYKVKEGDTLSHIAQRFYSKASKWTVIYEANADKIKNPDRLKVGTELIIPPLEEEESGYIK